MAARTNLDMDVLRTFVTGFELGSFARAADRLGRSQSAVSTQLRKLEDQVGQPLVRKSGRGLALTAAGEGLLGYARRILELNDEAMDRLHAGEVEGWVRLGLPHDFAEIWLPDVLGRFARSHPKVRVEVRIERNAHLVEQTLRGGLDLSLAWGDGEDSPHAERLTGLPVRWIGRPDWAGVEGLNGEPLPLIAFEQPCVFRAAGVAALDAAGIPWRLAFTSPSLAGLWAAAQAGLGVTLRTGIGVPKALAPLDPAATGLPQLPPTALSLHWAEKDPAAAAARLGGILRETISAHLGEVRA
jgi:DNA-binding transcriptional LysR family regulator